MSSPGSTRDRLQGVKAWRAWKRYGEVRGNVLAGGVAYFAFFSLFPALALGFTAFGLVVGGRADLQQQIADAINDTFGTIIIGTREGDGIVTIDRLVRDDVLTVTGLVGVVVLLFSGLGWIGALRDGLSAVFGRSEEPNVVVAKASDLGVLVVFGFSVLASAVGSVLVTSTTGLVLDWLGLGRSALAGLTVSVLSALVLLLIDTLLFLLLFRVLSGVTVRRDDVFTGALVGGVGIGLLKLGAGTLLRFASGNQFLATFSILVGLLIWLNLASRVVLLAGAWAAVTAADRGRLQLSPAAAPAVTAGPPGPAASLSEPSSPPPVAAPTYGSRAADRTTLLAGAVLGATAAVGVRLIGDAGRVLRGAVRRSD